MQNRNLECNEKGNAKIESKIEKRLLKQLPFPLAKHIS